MKNVFFEELSRLYAKMGDAYDEVATRIGLSCQGCPDNCCNSYFHHHTHIEWAYLWDGMRSCSAEKQQAYVERAREYVERSRAVLAQGHRPQIMCPLNDRGLCGIYEHRLMICRMHGIPNTLVRPDGRKLTFPGCFRCQELCSQMKEVPILDRTGFYKEMARLEIAFVGPNRQTLPRVRLTLAEMLVQGPPKV